ncbi:S8 family peptidase [Rhizohabitans arisaemae]|uniref:S8 family peptidase n=1 Tax=Rhizohabitans arisaemae TaxID=2720610 RepID=UPI0024B2360D|nr:S8 family serine peptidase [Rhizohabitans arisaemae]
MGRLLIAGAVSAALIAVASVVPAGDTTSGMTAEYVVLLADGRRTEGLAAIDRAGGVVVGENSEIGVVLVESADAGFSAAVSPQVAGVTRNTVVGRTAAAAGRAEAEPTSAAMAAPAPLKAEPLAGRQWDMKMIGATVDGSYKRAPGSKKVLVGVIDSGIDGKHPDIAPNFNRALSRNFVDSDPVDFDGDGHGTHVASVIGSPLNGLGMAGVAPNVSLVNLRVATDDGFFFLKPTLDAITYAGRVGIDVLNMSFYIDPWLFNCPNNPADSAAERAQQRTIISATQRALDYARSRGVTLIAALGNEGVDLGRPTVDTASPNFPEGSAKERKINNSCVSVPAESKGVVAVSSVGPLKRKAEYSNYGIEQTDISAPGGDAGQGGTRARVLGAAPEAVLRKNGLLNEDGSPKADAPVVRECQLGRCYYYQYLQGTSMAAPHVAGVAAIIVSRFGRPGLGGLALSPSTTEAKLYATATPTGCPSSGGTRYADANHSCTGTKARNGFYGRGIVNALNAATRG